jgi:hypothetical protein
MQSKDAVFLGGAATAAEQLNMSLIVDIENPGNLRVNSILSYKMW